MQCNRSRFILYEYNNTFVVGILKEQHIVQRYLIFFLSLYLFGAEEEKNRKDRILFMRMYFGTTGPLDSQ